MPSAAARGTLGASNRAVDRPPGLGRARPPAGDRLGRSSAMRVLLAGATGVIGRQAVPVLAAAGHQVTGLARTPARLPDAEVVAVDVLDPPPSLAPSDRPTPTSSSTC
jgi:hypothetical protein